MSDENTNTGAAPDQQDGQQDGAARAAAAPNLRIVAHFIRDLSFENVAAQQGAAQAQGTPEIGVMVNLDGGSIADTRYQLGMKITATAKVGESTRFIAELDYVGVFDITGVPKEHMHPFLFIECPRQLFPYARRVIADVTRDGGYPPLMLDNVDFAALYKQKLDEMRAQPAGAKAN